MSNMYSTVISKSSSASLCLAILHSISYFSSMSKSVGCVNAINIAFHIICTHKRTDMKSQSFPRGQVCPPYITRYKLQDLIEITKILFLYNFYIFLYACNKGVINCGFFLLRAHPETLRTIF